MENWKDKLDGFFEANNLKKKVADFDQANEKEIQDYIESNIKPAFEEFKSEVNSRPNVECQVLTSKKATTSLMENVELRFYKTTALKFIYKPFFTKNEDGIFVTFKYSIANLYGEDTTYNESNLSGFIHDISQSKILDNLTSVFVDNSIWK